MNARRAIASLCLAACACSGARPASTRTPTGAAAHSPVAAEAKTAASEEDAEVPISPSNPSRGSRTALVTIVEFADFECPYCMRAEATLAEVVEMYGPETVRIVWKHNPLPFHPNAASAAEASAGVFALAGAGAFWRFHDSALRRANSLGPQSYEEWAQEAGVLDLTAFRAGLSTHIWAAAVGKDTDEAKALGVMGTPTFFVNGHPLAGALPFPTFRGVIDEQVRLAQAKVASGTPLDRIYVELTRENRARQQQESVDDEHRPAPKTVYRIPIGKSPVRGSPSALVTLVEFADYQCPFCIRAEATLKELRDEYGDKLRVVYKDAPLPFHPRAEPASEAALEVRAEKGDAAFWAMHDELLGDPPNSGTMRSCRLLFGSVRAPKRCGRRSSNHTHQRTLEDDADLAEDFEANGTPHFFVNGRRLVGAQPKAEFDKIIDEEIRRAQGALANGTKPEALYDELLRDAQGPAEPEKKSLPITFSDHDPTRGNASAKVTLHEWSDFQCPFCKRAQAVLDQVAREFGAKVKIVWHDLPLSIHPDAALAARAAREAQSQKGEPAFWALHDVLFAHQQDLKRDDLDGYARAAGLDMKKWKAALDGDAHQEQINADGEVAAGIDISGTPAFVIVAAGTRDGYFVSGAQSYSKFRRLIERALLEAK